MIVLQNNDYYVRLNLEGGQVSRFRNEISGIEYIHDANPEYWAYSTPTLFPVIGSSYDGKYHFDGHTTEMKNHGILRNAKFMVKSHVENEVTLSFEANEETYQSFPFYFSIDIKYTLVENKLVVEYEISNDGVIAMPYNFGLHPAFRCPLDVTKTFEDYKLTFSSPTELKGVGARVNDGLVSEVPLTYEGFKDDPTWIYHGLPIESVGITDGTYGLDVSVVGFPIVSVWTNADKKAPFVCIEPWLGVGRKSESDLNFKDRDATMLLEANKKFKLTYTITAY